jgi:hypothetical protein
MSLQSRMNEHEDNIRDQRSTPPAPTSECTVPDWVAGIFWVAVTLGVIKMLGAPLCGYSCALVQ